MHLANLVINAGVEQNALGRRGFAGINMRGNTDIPISLNRSLSSHHMPRKLEPEMGESLICLSHAVNLVTTLHGRATTLGGLHQLISQALGHGFLTTFFSRLTDPAHSQGRATLGTHFNRNLVISATDTAGFNLNNRFHIAQRQRENLNGIFAAFRLNRLESTIDNTFGDGFFARKHDHIHKFGDIEIAEFWIGENFALSDYTAT
uniref:Putative Hemagglutinin 2 n=1 Tax=mine drainage metagenome TaxID=410659 RepID=E6PKC6_9ZZZZ